jgi:hypothetical protein
MMWMCMWIYDVYITSALSLQAFELCPLVNCFVLRGNPQHKAMVADAKDQFKMAFTLLADRIRCFTTFI